MLTNTGPASPFPHLAVAKTTEMDLCHFTIAGGDLLKTSFEECARARGDDIPSLAVIHMRLYWTVKDSVAGLDLWHLGLRDHRIRTHIDTKVNNQHDFDPYSLSNHLSWIPLSTLTTLEVNLFVEKDIWKSFVAPVKTLTSLYVGDDAIPSLLCFLEHEAENRDQILPGLSKLRLSLRTGIKKQYTPLSFSSLSDFIAIKSSNGQKMESLIVAEPILEFLGPKATLTLSREVALLDWERTSAKFTIE